MVSEGKEGPELCGRFLFWKSCAEKIQQNVTVKRENQILSVKKKKKSISQLAQKRRGGQNGRKSCSLSVRQVAGFRWARPFP